MSKVDLALQEESLRYTKEFLDTHNKSFNKSTVNESKESDIDLETWLEVFKDDEVKHEMCH
ncbi:MAG: hypothetical protein COA44_13945 [Arcobacter sp.]|nr:MAG: hypothetical protein COA44_13945 [Arcobacter sp.]